MPEASGKSKQAGAVTRQKVQPLPFNGDWPIQRWQARLEKTREFDIKLKERKLSVVDKGNTNGRFFIKEAVSGDGRQCIGKKVLE